MDGFKAFQEFFSESDGDMRLAPVHLWLYMAFCTSGRLRVLKRRLLSGVMN